MSEPQINAALRLFLVEPLTEDQKTAIEFYKTPWAGKLSQFVIAAGEVLQRNAALPNDYTTSLNSCRLVENRLDASQRLRYSWALMRTCQSGWEGLPFAPAQNRAKLLVEILDLEVDNR